MRGSGRSGLALTSRLAAGSNESSGIGTQGPDPDRPAPIVPPYVTLTLPFMPFAAWPLIAQ